MRLVVTHLTRMHGGHICVAGLDHKTHRHVRPVLKDSSWTARRHARKFALGNEVDYQTAGRLVVEAPHVEDHSVNADTIRVHRRLSPGEFWDLLRCSAAEEIGDVFGDSLQPLRRSRVCAPGSGVASLGLVTLSPGSAPKLRADAREVRIELRDSALGLLDLAVNDLRFYCRDGEWGVDTILAEVVGGRLAAGEPTILGFGLTRPWGKAKFGQDYCWLQVTGIYPEDDPYWS